ncbi:MAG: hypothetical protein MK111_19270, partial [Crocosphaera sp.]|uniref:hypothetical protein n=1 Tax=Crocosphaera sp. TaxID=2729996 RepID=UPI00258668A4
MPEVIIPIYILPCSSDTNEYKCYIDCEDIALRLNAGILVRPKLEVWVGHTDINRSYLAQVIRREFATQLDAARNKVKNQQLTPKMQDELSQQRDKLAEQSQSRITTAALSGGIIFLLTTGPWVTLFLTMMAVSSGVQGISDALELLSLNQEIKQGKQGNLQAQQKLEQKLAAGGRRFVRAVSQLKLKTHPTLQCLAAAFCQIDGCSSSFSPPCKDPAPNLTHFLNSR